jgi:flagellar FliL protein
MVPTKTLLARLEPASSRAHRVAAGVLTVVLCTAAFAAWWGPRGGRHSATLDLDAKLTYHSLAPIITDLRAPPGQNRHVKVGLMLEVARDDLLRISENEATIQQAIQTIVRDLRAEDIRGSAGSNRLRAALRAAIDAKIAPARLHSLLLTELIID